MKTKKIFVGDIVRFGVKRGEKTIGRVTGLTRARVIIQTGERRGKTPKGTTWRASPVLVTVVKRCGCGVRR